MILSIKRASLFNFLFSISLVMLFATACQETGGNESEKNINPQAAEYIPDPHSYSRLDQCKVTHMKMDLRVDFSRQAITGIVKYEFERTGDHPLILDVRDLDIHKVFIDDKDSPGLEYTVGKSDPLLGAPLTIQIPPQNDGYVHVMYSSRPSAAALQWLEAEQTADKKMGFLYTQGQAILTRTWIPCQDSPGARITYDADVLVPVGMMAAMSAKNPTEKDGTGRYAFTMRQPIPPYLIALAVGEFQFAAIGPETGVYAEPSMIEKAVYEFGQIQEMLEAAEALYGPYLWERYDVLVLPPSFPFGGMENPRLTFATPTILAGDRSLTSLIAHELAHSWSGNLVTNATWDDFWLNEGFTVYFERRIMEALYGNEYTQMLALLGFQDLEHEVEDLGEHSHDTHLKLDLENRDPDEGMTDIAYEKGAYFLILLEQQVGRKKFDAFLKKYFDDHKFQTMSTAYFIQYLNANLIKPNNLDIDINEWIFGPGIPSNAPKPVSDKFEGVESTFDGLKHAEIPSDEITANWTTHEWLHFLRYLPDGLGSEVLDKLDNAYGFTKSGNSEIQAAWFEYSLDHQYHEAIMPELEAFLVKVGRRKFLTPLYKALLRNGLDTDAKRIYAAARPNYHSVSRGTIDGLFDSNE